jgi:hypothetical protein
MTQIVTATATTGELGPLTQVVRRFTEAQGKVLAAGVSSPADWAPVAEFVAVDTFRRVGAYLEEFDWGEYTRFLTGWASGGTAFEYMSSTSRKSATRCSRRSRSATGAATSSSART